MSLKFPEFSNMLNENKISPIYLFEGEDAYFRAKAIESLKSKLVTEPDLNYASFNGEGLAVSELTASLECYPFLGGTRLTVVKEFYPDKKGLELLKPFLENPLQNSILAIVNVKEGESLKKYSSVCVVSCKKLDQGFLTRFVKSQFEKNGVSIELECARLIVDYCLSDMAKISNEIEKLSSYALETKTVTVKDVKLLIAKDMEYEIFAMTECIGKKNVAQALSIINDMLAKGEPPQRIIFSVYNYFRRLLHVAISNKEPTELARLIGIKGKYADYILQKTKAQAKMFTPKALKKAVDMLTDIDYKSKSGLITDYEGMWLSLFKIMVEK